MKIEDLRKLIDGVPGNWQFGIASGTEEPLDCEIWFVLTDEQKRLRKSWRLSEECTGETVSGAQIQELEYAPQPPDNEE